MSEGADPRPPVDSSPETLRAAIRATALGALVAGGICLFFGFHWLIDAPASSSAASEPTWYAIDHVFRWVLRVVGAAFLVVAWLARSGRRLAAGLGAAVETVFALLLLAMAVETFAEARADGRFDAMIIVLAIVMVMSVSAARHSWSLYRRGG